MPVAPRPTPLPTPHPNPLPTLLTYLPVPTAFPVSSSAAVLPFRPILALPTRPAFPAYRVPRDPHSHTAPLLPLFTHFAARILRTRTAAHTCHLPTFYFTILPLPTTPFYPFALPAAFVAAPPYPPPRFAFAFCLYLPLPIYPTTYLPPTTGFIVRHHRCRRRPFRFVRPPRARGRLCRAHTRRAFSATFSTARAFCPAAARVVPAATAFSRRRRRRHPLPLLPPATTATAAPLPRRAARPRARIARLPTRACPAHPALPPSPTCRLPHAVHSMVPRAFTPPFARCRLPVQPPLPHRHLPYPTFTCHPTPPTPRSVRSHGSPPHLRSTPPAVLPSLAALPLPLPCPFTHLACTLPHLAARTPARSQFVPSLVCSPRSPVPVRCSFTHLQVWLRAHLYFTRAFTHVYLCCLPYLPQVRFVTCGCGCAHLRILPFAFTQFPSCPGSFHELQFCRLAPRACPFPTHTFPSSAFRWFPSSFPRLPLPGS